MALWTCSCSGRAGVKNLADDLVKALQQRNGAALADLFHADVRARLRGLAAQLAMVPASRPRMLFQFATGDQTVPNPTESALVRAAGMRQSTWIFRNDLARAAFPSLPANPHAYLTNLFSGATALSIALSTQTQIAGFFTSNGTTIPDPNAGGLNFFEMPAALPETLGFK